MKKSNKLFTAIILSASLMILVYSPGNAQRVNNFPLDSINVEYVQIVGTQKLLSTKVQIDLDFGQRNKYWVFKDTQITDEDGKILVLNSMIDALNFMTKHGYEFVQAYAFSEDSGANVYHYLLRRSDTLKEKIKKL